MAPRNPDQPVIITITTKLAWWVRPYLTLTRFGVWIGLPLNPEVIGNDLAKGLKVKVRISIGK